MWTIINLSSQSPFIKLLLLILPLFLDREGKAGFTTYLDSQQLWGPHWGKKKIQKPKSSEKPEEDAAHHCLHSRSSQICARQQVPCES